MGWLSSSGGLVACLLAGGSLRGEPLVKVGGR